jgi:hypothetical protein
MIGAVGEVLARCRARCAYSNLVSGAPSLIFLLLIPRLVVGLLSTCASPLLHARKEAVRRTAIESVSVGVCSPRETAHGAQRFEAPRSEKSA